MKLEVSREIAAPAARVWDVVTDLAGSADVLGAIEKIEILEGPAPKLDVGTRWRETRTMFGKSATEEMVVTAVDHGRSYTVEADAAGALYRSVMTVEPLGDQRTRLSMSFGAEPKSLGSKLMSATVGRLFAGATRKALYQDLDDIAEAAERG